MRHIISILMANEAGALVRVAGMFSSRGYNIESLCVAATEDPSVSRLTMVTTGSDEVISQINQQLAKLVDVVDMADMTRGDHIERELLFVKLALDEVTREEAAAIAERYNAQVLDERVDNYTVQLTGAGLEVEDFIKELSALGDILEVVRSGAAAIAHGPQVLKLS